jgi:hypothetical protein
VPDGGTGVADASGDPGAVEVAVGTDEVAVGSDEVGVGIAEVAVGIAEVAVGTVAPVGRSTTSPASSPASSRSPP